MLVKIIIQINAEPFFSKVACLLLLETVFYGAFFDIPADESTAVECTYFFNEPFIRAGRTRAYV